MIWHGYILIEKPQALTSGEWFDVLVRLRTVLDTLSDDWNVARRLHWRLSNAGDKVIICAGFNSDDINIEDLSRLPRYIQVVIPRFTVEQVRDAMRDHITVFGGISGTLAQSRQAALIYLSSNTGSWDGDVE